MRCVLGLALLCLLGCDDDETTADGGATDGTARDVVVPGDGPAGDGPVTDGPVTDGPVTDGPVTDGPISDGPVTDGPVSDGPVTDGPLSDGPVTDGPVTDGPVSDGPLTDGPAPDANLGNCVAEGDSAPVIQDSPECCPGTAPIPCDQPGANGVCPQGCAGAFICAQCGNNECGPGENACNCPEDCADNGQCRQTSECFDHGAPIRCQGVWRCDPGNALPSDNQGDDGCNYSCVAGLEGCNPNDPQCAEGDLCRPCPFAESCQAQFVCLDPDEGRRCRDNNVGSCAGLAHDDCDGAWACEDELCTWACN